ncbi:MULTISPECIES: 2-succinyl-5-enolpyruvyl-6-hydroxy-3-cyclohexene-1-carboxylic-acid synthase [unclassified Halomonas]|uniref:2-succinyl-5-enolpyruvyl-6-hydroxy-3- cyclohexene-1-carboxylic-acid synthase n=1 Tax=unclassified Halomonas TaxID=2609666 RepID=UPI0007DA272C|nr:MULTISPECIES: 2-succinyl-5-enolpyruvyl-6-hydroxy-3-cyclohexene-1-carboxylic-acid synthase [unclassified Halomonas]MBT2786219.1 2-succinyl-5-enolpyruvyl-6-hydroxy-3-cyclohexene-1-carboxylic-acid synthase [Halomonas sp. ISL-106]MBT2797241.1 2-succinyl-5-enolpyruvyl-6-hydroxy-3-cyclohexene-1-carboxylic-acid synthase [Halomonas sp. ISL-104]OAL58617.1 2-succinyl-5-enolpyruvyl-6-hydroxy-3-cyclohexene-1-carboxylic-acid synthase [Halomonas sp. ALS9]
MATPVSSDFAQAHATFNHVWAALMLEELYRLGVRDVVLAPGSRSSPLTMTASKHAGLRCHCHFDERGLGFMALGIARGSQRAVAIITTSGTAVANLYPAVVEAKLLGVPLIVLSADRPIELLDNGSNQAIDQRDIFSRHTIVHHDLPPPDADIKAAFLLSTIDQAIDQQRRTPGPLHINCRYREPLYPGDCLVDASDYLAPLGNWLMASKPWSDWSSSKVIPALNNEWETFAQQRGLIVVGSIDDPQQAQQVVALAKQLGWPLLADVQSQLRFDPHNLIHFDLALHDERFSAELAKAEVLLQFGGRLISKRLTQFIAQQPWQDVWLVDPLPQRLDPDYCVKRRLIGLPADFIAALPAHSEQSPWHQLDSLQRRTSHLVEEQCTAFSELGVCHQLAQLAEGQLFIGNSLPARLMNMLGRHRQTPLQVFANRGASGIDGLIATAYGLSCTCSQPTTIVLGDTSALHDLNSLALLKQAAQPLVVVILNNDGGSIFHMLPVPKGGELLERYYRQPHGLNFEYAAKMFGLGHSAPDSLDAFVAAYTQALAAGVTLIEVNVPHQQVADDLKALGAAIRG